MDMLDVMKERRSIRKYQDKQIGREDLEKIIEAGLYAPNAGGGQRARIVAVHNKELAEIIGRLNLTRFDRSRLAGGHVSSEQPSTIRLSAKVENVPEHEQRKWIDIIFEEQPYLSNVYPGSTREIGIVFCIRNAEIEYFNLGVSPIFRERYAIGNAGITEKGYVISQNCIGCGKCMKNCPQNCIVPGKPYEIMQEHCLHCGNCYEKCPAGAVKRRGVPNGTE